MCLAFLCVVTKILKTFPADSGGNGWGQWENLKPRLTAAFLMSQSDRGAYIGTQTGGKFTVCQVGRRAYAVDYKSDVFEYGCCVGLAPCLTSDQNPSCCCQL